MGAEAEPDLDTDTELAGVLEELMRREMFFHRPEMGTTRADFEAMTIPDFWEMGASGRRYGRDYVLDLLEKRQRDQDPDFWQTSDSHCRRLSPDVFLLTYTLLQQNDRLTRRSSIWQRMPEGWQIVFHQGTIVQDS